MLFPRTAPISGEIMTYAALTVCHAKVTDTPGATAAGFAVKELYFKSVNTTVDYYRKLLCDVRSRTLALHDTDLDTGARPNRESIHLRTKPTRSWLTGLEKRISPAWIGPCAMHC
jgi:superfamily II RNA helicase